MNRRLRAAAVALFTVGLIATLPGPAVAATEPAIGVSPQILPALSRDLNLDVANLGIRLANEASASSIDLKLRSMLGDRYAGSWLSPDASVLNVGVTDSGAAALAGAAGAAPRLVRYSLTQLKEIAAGLDAKAAKAPTSVPVWYVDVRTNSVVVLYRGDLDAAKAWAGAAVRYELSSEVPKTAINIIGGNAYFINDNTRCSIGFSVWKAGTFEPGFVTAGHCGSAGASTTQPTGVVAGSSFPGDDYAWVRAPGNNPRPWINTYPGTHLVGRALEAPVGTSVCRSGSTTGWRCGTIQARDVTVMYQEGTVTGLIRTNACADFGDSGGPLVDGNFGAQGVLSGKSGDCTTTSATTYFQPVEEILQAYGLWLAK